MLYLFGLGFTLESTTRAKQRGRSCGSLSILWGIHGLQLDGSISYWRAAVKG
jgi:hypothetical protein